MFPLGVQFETTMKEAREKYRSRLHNYYPAIFSLLGVAYGQEAEVIFHILFPAMLHLPETSGFSDQVLRTVILGSLYVVP